MSYKDLESSIREWAAIEDFAKKQKEAAKAEKRLRKAKALRPALYRPDAPPAQIEVVLLVRNGALGDLIEALFKVSTMSELQAEREAKAKAQADGLIWRGTVSVMRVSK